MTMRGFGSLGEPTTEAVAWHEWQAVNALLQGFADAFDRADLPALLALFAPNAAWEHGPESARHGRDEIGAFLSGRFAVYAQTSHLVGPPVVRRSGNGLASVAYLIATHVLRTGTSYTGHGRYLNTYGDVGGVLLITRHKVVAHVTQGISAPVDQLDRMAT